jgi:trk system potassium uptake protein TrkH
MPFQIKYSSFKSLLKLHPATLLILSFVSLIITGTFLLKLSISTNIGYISLIDAIFTATSAVCVTGLVVVDTGRYFTIFGQCVILMLIQIGGLGVMTVSVLLFKLIGKNITFRQRMALQETFAHSPRADIFQLLKTIFIFTVIVELIGICVFFIHWVRFFPIGEALYLAVFHSISTFCNAGFSLFSDSMIRASGDWFLNVNMCLLIIMGGIGFPVI